MPHMCRLKGINVQNHFKQKYNAVKSWKLLNVIYMLTPFACMKTNLTDSIYLERV